MYPKEMVQIVSTMSLGVERHSSPRPAKGPRPQCVSVAPDSGGRRPGRSRSFAMQGPTAPGASSNDVAIHHVTYAMLPKYESSLKFTGMLCTTFDKVYRRCIAKIKNQTAINAASFEPTPSELRAATCPASKSPCFDSQVVKEVPDHNRSLSTPTTQLHP